MMPPALQRILDGLGPRATQDEIDDIRERFLEVAGAALNDGATQTKADAKAEANVRQAVKDGRLNGSGVLRR